MRLLAGDDAHRPLITIINIKHLCGGEALFPKTAINVAAQAMRLSVSGSAGEFKAARDAATVVKPTQYLERETS